MTPNLVHATDATKIMASFFLHCHLSFLIPVISILGWSVENLVSSHCSVSCFIVDLVRGHIGVEYSEWCQPGIIEKFKMATKMATKTVFILKLVYNYVVNCIVFCLSPLLMLLSINSIFKHWIVPVVISLWSIHLLVPLGACQSVCSVGIGLFPHMTHLLGTKHKHSSRHCLNHHRDCHSVCMQCNTISF